MRRILATLLLMATGLTLAPAALLFASDDSDLPACCRRDGKHKCAMTDMQDDDGTPGATMRGVSKCPVFPARTSSSPAGNVAGVPVPRSESSVAIASYITTPAQLEAQYQVSFNRSRQKRGPPSFLFL